ncbi:MAG: hypothetical protein KDJ15_03870, partial [Alphaproteobacteria bacterium]|nr:hypothetical protein [Alphaproteobacteria bacterium]
MTAIAVDQYLGPNILAAPLSSNPVNPKAAWNRLKRIGAVLKPASYFVLRTGVKIGVTIGAVMAAPTILGAAANALTIGVAATVSSAVIGGVFDAIRAATT